MKSTLVLGGLDGLQFLKKFCGETRLVHLPRPPQRNRFRRDVFRNDRAGARQRIIAHSDRRDKHGVGADEHPFADGGAVFHHPVVIAGDSPRADVGAFAHIGIAQIGQMADLDAFAKDGVLDLNKIKKSPQLAFFSCLIF